MSWLVTGGAGYIGSHVVRAFKAAGITPVVIDDLSSGFEKFVPNDVALVRSSVLDTEAVGRALQEHDCVGVVHLAGFKYAGVSVQRPLHTYDQNVQGTVSLLRAMQDVGVHNYVFSSSASVYGTPDVDLVTEDTALKPESPYGQSKLIGEWLGADIAAVDPAWRFTNLRYFNVVGSGAEDLYDASPHNLFPIVFNALLSGTTPKIFGDDYPTPDGTCVRDYIHVADLADAHVAAAQAMTEGRNLEYAYNLGSGDGSSVAEIMQAIARVTGIDFQAERAPRRPGDPARIVANGDLAARDLGWRMTHDLDDMVASAWNAARNA